MKHIFAITFSGIILVALPAFDMSRVEAWMLILMLISCGMEIAYLAEGAWNRLKKRRCMIGSGRRRSRTGRRAV